MKILGMLGLSLLALVSVAGAHAKNADRNVVTHVFTDTVAPAQQEVYEAGEKAWSQCLREHGFKYNVGARQRETGSTRIYTYEIGPYTWADLDKMRPTVVTCDATFGSQASPHIQDETNSLAIDRPDLSYTPSGQRSGTRPRYLDIVHFTLKPGHAADEAFTSAFRKIVAAAIQSHWPHPHRIRAVRAGGEGAPDYVMVIPVNSWSEYGEKTDAALWRMVESVYGKPDADALRKTLDDAIAKSSEHIDNFREDLGYVADE